MDPALVYVAAHLQVRDTADLTVRSYVLSESR